MTKRSISSKYVWRIWRIVNPLPTEIDAESNLQNDYLGNFKVQARRIPDSFKMSHG